MPEPHDDVDYARRSARVLLLDGAERLLLFEAWVDHTVRDAVCWFTPGGGVEAGEALVETAVRELREEIGLHVDPADLGAPVAYAFGPVALTWTSGIFRDDFFVLRVEAHEVDISGFQADEREIVVGHRWWPVHELRTTAERVFPPGLPGLLDALLSGSRPAPPVRLPWHHDESP